MHDKRLACANSAPGRIVANLLRRRDITATHTVEGDFMANAELRIEAGRDLRWGRRAGRPRPEEGQIDTGKTCSMRLVTQPWRHR